MEYKYVSGPNITELNVVSCMFNNDNGAFILRVRDSALTLLRYFLSIIYLDSPVWLRGTNCAAVLWSSVVYESGRFSVAMFRFSFLLIFPLLFESVFPVSFYLPVNSRKCLREEIHKDVLVTGEYEVSEQPNTKTNLKVSVTDWYT